jgi:hypothetical protein
MCEFYRKGNEKSSPGTSGVFRPGVRSLLNTWGHIYLIDSRAARLWRQVIKSATNLLSQTGSHVNDSKIVETNMNI